MSRLLVRITIVGVALYLIACYIMPLVFAVDIWNQSYWLLFEACVCLCITAHGKYHCRYIRWTAYAILASDTMVCVDNIFDVFPVSWMVYVPAAVIAAGLLTTLTLAVRHYIRAKRLKKIWKTE